MTDKDLIEAYMNLRKQNKALEAEAAQLRKDYQELDKNSVLREDDLARFAIMYVMGCLYPTEAKRMLVSYPAS